jgi:lysophospholipid acyltransferase (LPLAT)-like uncharacterized protein
VPSGFAADRAWRMKSWDRFTVPKPFARVGFVFGTPIEVARHATTAVLEQASLDIAAAMHACEKRASAILGQEHEP